MQKRIKILLVESAHTFLVSKSEVLAKNGYEVLVGKTSIEAIEAIKSNIDLDLVLVNLDLNNAESGLEITKKIASIRVIPFVLLVDKVDKEIKEEIKKISRYGFTQKRADNEILNSTIEMALELFQTNQKLVEIERRSVAALQNTHQALLDWNLNDDSVYYCTHFKTMLGYKNDEISSQFDEWESRIHTDDKSIVLSKLDECIKGEIDFFKQMYRLQTKSKTYIWVLHEARTTEDNFQHKTKHFIGTLKNITSEYRNQELFKKVAEHIPGMIYQYRLRNDGTSYFPYVSSGIKSLYNLNPEDVALDAKPIFDKIHPDDFPFAFNSITDSKNTLSAWKHKFRVLKNLDYIWVSGESSPERLEDGSILWHGYIQECVQSNERNPNDFDLEQLKKRLDLHTEILWNENLRRYFDDAPIAIFKANVNGDFTYVNQTAANMLGYLKTELLQLGIKDISSNDDVNRSRFNEIKKVKKLEGILKLKKKDGTLTVTNYNAFQISNDSFLSFNICIDDQINHQKMIEKQKQYYEQILDLIPINVYTVDSMSAFQFVNRKMLDDIGVCLHDIKGKTAYDFYPTEDVQKYLRDDKKVIRSKKTLKIIEQYVVPKTQIKQVVQTIKSPILDNDNKVNGIVGIIYDISSYSQEVRAKEEKLVEQDVLIKQVHKRIKENLNLIIEIMNLQVDLSNNNSFKNGINEAISRLVAFSFINDKLYKNNSQSFIEINEYLLELQLDLIHNLVPNRIGLQFEIEKLQIDEKKALIIGIIIIELITNSIKYAFQENKDGLIEAHLNYENGIIVLTYSDDGVGYPEDVLQGKRKGFGLKMIQKLLTKVDGKFNIESKNKVKIQLKI